MANLKEMVRRIFEQGVSRGDLSVFDELIADDYKNHDMPAPAPGREGFKQIVVAWREAFPDLQMKLLDIVAEGDMVVTRGVFNGTHRGAFNGIPATGKKIEVAWIDMWRAKDGKLVENWVRIDMVSMLTQLGVMPPPPA